MYGAAVVQEALQRRREPWRWGVQGQAIRSWQQPTERIIKADPLVTTGEAAEEPQRWSFYGRSAFEANWKGEKAQSECLTCCVLSHFSCVRLFEIQRTLAHQTLHGIRASGKKIILKYHLLLFYTTVNHFLIGLWYVTRSRFYMTTGHDQLSTKTNLPQKEVTVTVWWSAACLIHYSFLNPSKTITSLKCAQQIDETQRKLQRLQLALVNRMGPVLTMTTPDLTSHNQRFKSWTSGSWSFASSVIVTWPFANLLSLLQVSRQLFAGKMLP